jgi:hypothetical protein
MRSRRKRKLATAIAAGIDAMITPADTALVRLTPNSMQIENMKLPRNDSRNTRPRVRGVMGGSSGGRRSQCGMARAAMPKRSQASSSTGKAATSGLDSAT